MQAKYLATLLLLSLCLASNLALEIVQITEHSRHGARTARHFFPNKSIPEEATLGEMTLTGNGKRQHYLLGLDLKRRYSTLFSKLKETDIEALASSSARTQDSALSQLLAIFPFGTGKMISGDMSQAYWLPPFEGIQADSNLDSYALPKGLNPMVISIDSKLVDDMFNPDSGKLSCPNSFAKFKKYEKEIHKKFKPQIEPVLKYLDDAGFSTQEMFNKPSWDLDSVGTIDSELRAWENYYGKKYDKIPEEAFAKLRLLHSLKFTSQFEDEDIRRVRTHRLAQNILAGMQNFVDDKKDKKIFRSLVGHDTGLHSFTIGHGLSSSDCILKRIKGETVDTVCEDSPDFTSTYLYELAKDEANNFYVRILYNGVPFKVCSENIEDHYCKFEEFKKKMQEHFMMGEEDFMKKCGNLLLLRAEQAPEIRMIVKQKSLLVWIILLSLVCIILLLLAIWKCRIIQLQKQLEAENPREPNLTKTMINNDEFKMDDSPNQDTSRPF